MKNIILILSIIVACANGLRANPLAITEVVTAATGSNPDWWELSNFSTNDISLAGYSWNDDGHGGFAGATNAPFVNGLVIHGRESIIFSEIKGTITSPAAFRAWWNLPVSQQVVMLGDNPGLGNGGDSVRLWSTNVPALAGNTNGLNLDQAPEFLVDKVDTLVASAGLSQYYNPTNGLFGRNSITNLDGAFQAFTTSDVGSPGYFLTNPAPIVLVNQPTNQLVNVGATVSFQINAFGQPKPRFQWLFNGVPVDTNTATIVFSVVNNYCRSVLTITNVQVTNGGTFRAVVSDGFQTVVSSNATLTVNTTPFAPVFTLVPPTNLYVYPGQTLTLTAGAFANPPPTFQWQYNGTNIDGQTDAQYTLGLSDTNQTGTYTVIATNSAGGTNASSLVVVTPKPNLRITEILSSENAGGGHNDWWELSNLGSFPVNLLNFRFDDDSAFKVLPFSQAYTIPTSVFIAPGESVVLVEDMTPDAFRTWWGADQLPANLQIVNYHASGLSFSGTLGDSLTLWNAAATSENDFIDSVSIAVQTNAISFGFDPYAQAFYGTVPGDFTMDGLSHVGVNGGIAATVNGDIGSPGTIVNLPKITALVVTNGGALLSWISQSNYTYSVQCKTNLTDPAWTSLTNGAAGDFTSHFLDPAADAQRFYRVVQTP